MGNAAYQAVAQYVTDPHVALTALAACEAETGCQSVNQIGGGPGRGPWQIEVSGSNAGVVSNGVAATDANANNPITALRYMLPRFEKAAASVPASLWNSDPRTAAFTAARIAECTNGNAGVPCPNGPAYSAAQISGGWARLTQNLHLSSGGAASGDCALKFPDGTCLNVKNPLSGTALPTVGGANLFAGIPAAIDAVGSPDTWMRAAFVVLGVGVTAMAAFMIFNNATNGGGNKVVAGLAV